MLIGNTIPEGRHPEVRGMEWYAGEHLKDQTDDSGWGSGYRTIVEDVTYNGETLLIVPESESVRYMVFWATPNGNM